MKVVMDFTANAGLLHVAQLLYQLEVMLLQSSLNTTKVSHSHNHILLLVLLQALAAQKQAMHM